MKTKKMPKKHNVNFDAFEKPKNSEAKIKKDKRSKKRPSIYDELDEMDEFVRDENEYKGFDNFFDDENEDLY